MTEPAKFTTPDAARLQALAKVKAREDGIRAAAAKQGRQQERQDLFQALGVQRLEDASMVNTLKAEHAAEIDRLKAERIQWVKEAKAHGRYQGVSLATVVLVPLAVFGMWWVISIDRADDLAIRRIGAQPAWTPPAQTEPQGFRP